MASSSAISINSIPRLFPGQTVVCLGSGPSLTVEDVEACRGRAAVIAVNRTYQLAPWADVLYAADYMWWHAMQWVPEFHGLKVSTEPFSDRRPADLCVLKCTGRRGLELNPGAVRWGGNSGYQAINVAVHLVGPHPTSKIVLLGYDMQPGPTGVHHWHPPHPGNRHVTYREVLPRFASLVEPLQQLGISIVNCTRTTALTCFPQAPLEAVL